MTELARAAGPLAAVGLAVLVVAPRREVRLAGHVDSRYIAPRFQAASDALASLAQLLELLARQSRTFSQIVSAPETKKFLADSGADPLINTPEKAQEMFQTAIKEWGEYVRMAKIPQI